MPRSAATTSASGVAATTATSRFVSPARTKTHARRATPTRVREAVDGTTRLPNRSNTPNRTPTHPMAITPGGVGSGHEPMGGLDDQSEAVRRYEEELTQSAARSTP